MLRRLLLLSDTILPKFLLNPFQPHYAFTVFTCSVNEGGCLFIDGGYLSCSGFFDLIVLPNVPSL